MSYSTNSSTYHIWLCSIATDKVLVDKQEEIEILQEKVTSLTLQLTERDENISQLMENMKGKQLQDILLYQIMCLALQSQVVQLRDQIKSYDPHLSQKFEEVLASQQEPDQLTQESDDRVDGTKLTKVSSSDHKTADITSQGKKLREGVQSTDTLSGTCTLIEI